MPRIAIGVGIVLAILATLGAFGSIPVVAILLVIAVLLIVYGGYEDFVKPRFRVEHRLNDWLQRRGWSVTIERLPQFNFILHITAPDSEKEILVSRDKKTRDDLLAFTSKVGLHPEWLARLRAMPDKERVALISDIWIYLTAKNLSVNFVQVDNGRIAWPPSIVIQDALAQDSSLSQHSVDMAAKGMELSILGVRHLIRKAVLPMTDPATESVPDSGPPESQ